MSFDSDPNFVHVNMDEVDSQGIGRNGTAGQTLKNIIVFGEKGSGKSSIINLLRQDGDIIEQSYPKVDLTFEVQQSTCYNFIEIAPFSEDSGVSKTTKFGNARALIKYLVNDGVHLLILVTRMGRITKTMEQNYNIIRQGLCLAQVPILLVITHCEAEAELGHWWGKNKQHFNNQGMDFASAISTCPVLPANNVQPAFGDCMRLCYDQTKKRLPPLIDDLVLPKAWKTDSWGVWLKALGKTLKNIYWSPSISVPGNRSLQLQESELDNKDA